jgi:hypothetical protein
MAGTLRGFTHLQRGDVAAAEADARRVMTTVEPHNPLAPAQVGPRVLLAEAWLQGGEPAAAIGLLGPIATDADVPSMLLSNKHVLSSYAAALLADGQVEAARMWSERAREAPAEDVRSGAVAAMVHARVLAAAGRDDEAIEAVDEAVLLAYSTQQASERAAAEDLRATLCVSAVEPSPPVALASDLQG